MFGLNEKEMEDLREYFVILALLFLIFLMVSYTIGVALWTDFIQIDAFKEHLKTIEFVPHLIEVLMKNLLALTLLFTASLVVYPKKIGAIFATIFEGVVIGFSFSAMNDLVILFYTLITYFIFVFIGMIIGLSVICLLIDAAQSKMIFPPQFFVTHGLKKYGKILVACYGIIIVSALLESSVYNWWLKIYLGI